MHSNYCKLVDHLRRLKQNLSGEMMKKMFWPLFHLYIKNGFESWQRESQSAVSGAQVLQKKERKEKNTVEPYLIWVTMITKVVNSNRFLLLNSLNCTNLTYAVTSIKYLKITITLLII